MKGAVGYRGKLVTEIRRIYSSYYPIKEAFKWLFDITGEISQ
jgi:hypothetical protein